MGPKVSEKTVVRKFFRKKILIPAFVVLVLLGLCTWHDSEIVQPDTSYHPAPFMQKILDTELSTLASKYRIEEKNYYPINRLPVIYHRINSNFRLNPTFHTIVTTNHEVDLDQGHTVNVAFDMFRPSLISRTVFTIIHAGTMKDGAILIAKAHCTLLC